MCVIHYFVEALLTIVSVTTINALKMGSKSVGSFAEVFACNSTTYTCYSYCFL